MNPDLKRFKDSGDRIHRRDWLDKAIGWFLVFMWGVIFGYAWHFFATMPK